uniref:Uncharacterized protein n=1 Tax=Picea glauca TaxID=3330 RepID=A0A101M3V7_PICGL|nr:hypothetical protein ABT39_MTgene275 [Picea glauca]
MLLQMSQPTGKQLQLVELRKPMLHIAAPAVAFLDHASQYVTATPRFTLSRDAYSTQQTPCPQILNTKGKQKHLNTQT